MKQKSFVLPIVLLAVFSAGAQNIKLPVGKKFNVVMETKMTTKTSLMGQSMELSNGFSNYIDYAVKAVTEKGYTLTNTVKRVKITTGIMGMDQTFDSNDPAAKNDAQYADVLKLINNPYDIEVEGKNTTSKGDIADDASQIGAIPGVANDPLKLILTKEDMPRIKEGAQWSDSVDTDEAKSFFEYTVLKVTPAITEILVKTTMSVNANVKQMGMDVKQVLKGTSNGRRQYDTVSGLLIKEDAEIAISGTMNMMGQSAPISIAGKATTAVNQ